MSRDLHVFLCVFYLCIYLFIPQKKQKKIGFFNKQKLFDLCRMSLYLQYIIFLLEKGLAGFLGVFFRGGGLNYFYYFPTQFNNYFLYD